MVPKKRKTAVVTGAGRGVGRAISIALARVGFDLVLVSKSEALLKETTQRVRQTNCEVESFPTDISDPAQVTKLGKNLAKKFQSIQLLVNCAFGHIGEDQGKNLLEVTSEELIGFANTSIVGTWLITKEVAPLLKKGLGRVVFIIADWGLPQHNVFLSTTGDAPIRLGSEAYASAKHAISGFANSIERMLGIQATGIYPGIIASVKPSESTDQRQMYFDIDEGAEAIEAEEVYGGGWAIPLRDVANSVIFAATTSCTVKAILLKPSVAGYDGLHV
jgi:NAD(P)-dependent dehydrogenase (short-subunit alcohol dehydrogenase family)